MNLKAVGLQRGSPHYTKCVDALNVYAKFGLNKMMDEVLSLGILFADYHIGNVMKRAGGGYVITDLGASRVFGDPDNIPVLETIDESVSDRVAVVHADLSPFNKAQAQFVRSLAREGKAVLLLKTGAVGFKELRGVIEASLPDTEASVEVYDAGDRGLPEVLRSVFPKSAALRPGVAVTLYSADGGEDADALRVLGSMVIARDIPPAAAPARPPTDAAAARATLDPHVFSDSGRTDDVMGALGIEEAVAKALVERYLADMGGVEGTTRAIEHNLPKLQKRLRMQSSRFLGAGSKGAVFDIGGNRILKVTSDVKDVSSAMKLKGRRLEHVTTIHDVFQMDPPPGVSIDIFGVVADKVDVLTEDEMNRFNEAFQYVRDSSDSDKLMSLLASNKLKEFFDALREDLQKEELENMRGGSLTKRQRALAELPDKIERRVRMIWDRLREFKVTDMVEELSSNGVLYADYKGDNLGRRGGEYVLLDVGGKSDGPAPPQLESTKARRPTEVKQELFSPTGQATMVNPAMRSQNTAWSMGDKPHLPSQSYSLTGSEDAAEDALKAQLGYIVRGAIGGLLRK